MPFTKCCNESYREQDTFYYYKEHRAKTYNEISKFSEINLFTKRGNDLFLKNVEQKGMSET